MSRFLTGFGAAVLLAGAAWFFTSAAPTGAQEKGKGGAPPVAWEYTMTNGNSAHVEFNKLGADGWELTTSYLNPSGVPIHTFKRQKR